MQEQQTTDTEMRKLRTGARHYKSPLPKENRSREENKDRTSVTTNHTKTGQQETSSHTTGKRMDHIDRTGSGETACFMQTINSHNHTHNHQAAMEVSTNQSKPTARNSIPKTMQNRKSESANVVPVPQQTTNRLTNPFVPSMKEFPVSMSANRTKRSLSANQGQPISKPQTQHQQTEKEQMDDVLETIHIALSGATYLLRTISTGNTHLVHVLIKQGRYQHTHRIDTVLPNNDPYQGNPHSSGRGRKVVSKTGLS